MQRDKRGVPTRPIKTGNKKCLLRLHKPSLFFCTVPSLIHPPPPCSRISISLIFSFHILICLATLLSNIYILIRWVRVHIWVRVNGIWESFNDATSFDSMVVLFTSIEILRIIKLEVVSFDYIQNLFIECFFFFF